MFIITGSSARRLRGVSANLLPGRVHQYHIFPVVLDERNVDRKSTLLPLPLKRNWNPGFPVPAIEEMLLYGNLPGVIQETRNSRKATLEAYSEIYLEEEIRREALVRRIGPFARFLELAALESGNIMNLTGLSQQLGIAVTTLRTFYQVLVDTFVGYWLMPFSTRSRKRLLTTPKFYFLIPVSVILWHAFLFRRMSCVCKQEHYLSNGSLPNYGIAVIIWAGNINCRSGERFRVQRLI